MDTNSYAKYELAHLTNTSATSFFAVEYNDGYSFESTNTSTSIPGAYDKWPGVVAQANNGSNSFNNIQFWSDAIWDLTKTGYC